MVEFVGLPGVGKSHATWLVAARLGAAGTPVQSAGLRVNHELNAWRRVLAKSAYCVREALSRPRAALRVWRAVTRTRQRRHVDTVRLWYNWLFLSGLLRRARARRVVELLDEGIFQLVWSIGLTGGERTIRDCSYALLAGPTVTVPLPDVVVLVQAPLEVVQMRLASRGSRAGRVDRLGDDERHAALVRGVDLLAEVLSEEVGLIGGVAGPILRRVRNATPEELEADVEVLVDELAALAA